LRHPIVGKLSDPTPPVILNVSLILHAGSALCASFLHAASHLFRTTGPAAAAC
jgi:hypothetical protein